MPTIDHEHLYDDAVILKKKDRTCNGEYLYASKKIPAGFNDDIERVCEIARINESIKFSYKKANRYIEKLRPKYKWITSHSCRRSFCTNEFLAGTPVELIMKISGHRSLRDFYRYIKMTPYQAAFQIEKIWKEREFITAPQPVG
jgi:integrase